MKFEHWEPNEIEQESLRRLGAELEQLRQNGEAWPSYSEIEELCVRRAIHATADFEFAKLLSFRNDACESALQALRSGALIVTDTQMALAGISKVSVKALKGEVHAFMSDPELAREAKSLGVTRARLCMDRAAELAASTGKPLILVIGNAPTALERIAELVRSQKMKPALILAAPVGFVNVLEGKAMIAELTGQPSLIVEGRKGGSNLAAALMNALLYAVYREAY